MQEYRFGESGYTIYITWDGKGWIINRVTNFGALMAGVGGKFQSQSLAIQFARRHYKIIRDLTILGY